MLETLRRQSGSFVIWLIFGIIIAAFVLFFGPQSSGDLGCGASNEFVVEVDGQALDIQDWRFAMNSQRSGLRPAERQTRALDMLVARTLLAHAAEASGMSSSEDLVVENLKRGVLYIGGIRLSKEAIFDNGAFSYERLEAQARQLGLPGVDALIAQQRDEVLANITRSLLVQTRVSREEAERVYIAQNTTATASYVRYDISDYQNALVLSDADIGRYLQGHESEIKELYEARKALYQDVKPQVRARHVMIMKPAPGEGPAEGDPTQLRARADEARAKLQGGADFAIVAREMSEDERTKLRGGDLGWRPVDSLGFGKELSDAAKSLDKGALSEVIETPTAFHVLRIDDTRSGTLSYDQVKLELAEDKARRFFATEAARRDAQASYAKLQGDTKLEDLFKPSDEPPPDSEAMTIDVPTSWGPIAQNTPAAGAAAPGTSAEPDTAAVPATADVAIPEITVKEPALRTLGPVSRRGEILPGLGRAPELAADLFGTLEPGQLGPKVYELDNSFVIARLDARENADLDQFDGEQVVIGGDFDACSFPLQLVAATRSTDSLPAKCLGLKKAIDSLQTYAFDTCSKAAQDGRIKVNTAFLTQDDTSFKYSPCGTLDFEWALVQVLSMSRGL